MITFDKGEQRFNYRVAGVAMDNGRVLIHRAEGDPFWTFPGGRCELGEPAAEALKREMREELGAEVEVARLLWLVENFFTYAGKSCHELALYFLMRFPEASEITKRQQPFHGSEGDLVLTFQWFPRHPQTLAKLPLLPSFLPNALQKLPESPQHLVHYD